MLSTVRRKSVMIFFRLPEVAAHQVVFPLDEVERRLAVDAVIALAAPERHDAVFRAMNDAHRALIMRGSAIDIKLLRSEHIFPPHSIEAEASDVLGRIVGVEGIAEEMAGLARVFDYCPGGHEDEGLRRFAFLCEPSCQHRGNHAPLRMSEKRELAHAGHRIEEVVEESRFQELFLDGHLLLGALALAVASEVDCGRGYSLPRQLLGQLGHGQKILGGEDAVHEYDHAAGVGGRVEPFGPGAADGNSALRALQEVVRPAGEEQQRKGEQ